MSAHAEVRGRRGALRVRLILPLAVMIAVGASGALLLATKVGTHIWPRTPVGLAALDSTTLYAVLRDTLVGLAAAVMILGVGLGIRFTRRRPALPPLGFTIALGLLVAVPLSAGLGAAADQLLVWSANFSLSWELSHQPPVRPTPIRPPAPQLAPAMLTAAELGPSWRASSPAHGSTGLLPPGATARGNVLLEAGVPFKSDLAIAESALLFTTPTAAITWFHAQQRTFAHFPRPASSDTCGCHFQVSPRPLLAVPGLHSAAYDLRSGLGDQVVVIFQEGNRAGALRVIGYDRTGPIPTTLLRRLITMLGRDLNPRP